MSLCSFIPTRCNNSMARRFFQPNHCHHFPLNVQFGIFWINCLPIFRLGSRQERGSWKSWIFLADQFSTFIRTEFLVILHHESEKRSAVIIQFSLMALQITLAIKLLPEPDSPTSPQISPSLIDKFMPSTILTRPFEVCISIFRLRMSSSAINYS